MKQFFYILWGCVVTPWALQAMDVKEKKADTQVQQDQNPPAMTPVKSWQDVLPFEGSMVAYTAQNYFFKDYTPDSQLYYGFMYKQERDAQLYMTRVIASGEAPSACGWADFLIKRDATLSMRKATQKEIEHIIDAVAARKIELAYYSQERALALLKQLKSQNEGVHDKKECKQESKS